jgi:hypothetical protein
MADTKYEKVWVQNIKGMLRGVPFTDEMKSACLREFEAFLSEADKREKEARAKALEEAALVAEKTGADDEKDWPGETWIASCIASSIRALQSKER